jgi:D-alanyl-D-alanine carboxypeptidase/D-alanyl-D-alanine-endopeptidase (penicillin-binding protein 4)
MLQMKTAIQVFALNEQYGLAPASTQKIFTSIAALSLLGKDFTYKTEMAIPEISKWKPGW